MTLKNEIRAYISTHLAQDITAEEIPLDYDLVGTGILNSLALVRLIAWLGDSYGIPVNDLDLAPADFRTVERICRFVVNNAVPASA